MTQAYQSGPIYGQVHIDVALTNFSVRYSNDEMIAEQVFPVMPVSKDSNVYFKYGKEHLRDYETRRAPGARANTMDWSVSHDDTYLTKEDALEMPIPNEVRDNADEPLNIEMDSTQNLTDALLLKLENRVAAVATNSANYDSDAVLDLVADGVPWSDYKNSDPCGDVGAARTIIHKKIMRRPNLMVLPMPVFNVLKNHPQVLARLSYANLKVVTAELLAELFEVQRVLIGGAVKITSVQGASTETSSYVWGNDQAMLYYVGAPGLKSLSYGQIFRRNGFRQTEKWYEQQRKTTVVRVADKTDQKVIAKPAGFLFDNAIVTA